MVKRKINNFPSKMFKADENVYFDFIDIVNRKKLRGSIIINNQIKDFVDNFRQLEKEDPQALKAFVAKHSDLHYL